jgi:AbrB family looped-hinge helix DNA binding protein
MKEQLTAVTRKGQITVPADIRTALGLQIGDKVAVSLDEGGVLCANLRPVRSVADVTFGALKPRGLPEEAENLRRQFMEAAQDRDERTKHIS